MAKANSTQPVPPFPEHIDRTAFGHWLSGFTDGEGCFKLFVRQSRPVAEFDLSLRADDYEILHRIRSFWGCGYITTYSNSRSKIPNAKPIARFTVIRMSDVLGVVVPHFEQFPLRAKKARDFAIWKKAAELCCRVSSQRQAITFKLNEEGTRNSFASISSKWTAEQLSQFVTLKDALREQRLFRATTA